jgi:hypothetical protein
MGMWVETRMSLIRFSLARLSHWFGGSRVIRFCGTLVIRFLACFVIGRLVL